MTTFFSIGTSSPISFYAMRHHVLTGHSIYDEGFDRMQPLSAGIEI